MNTTLTALNGFLLALSWQADPGITYTVQTSADLVDWVSLPYVYSGREGLQTLSLEAGPEPVFTRMRYSHDGDSNANGLPDLWEWEHFNTVDIDPSADPDEDGLSNYIEWLDGSDPQDYFNGIQPRIRLACGTSWVVQANEVSTQSVALAILNESAEPIPGAPVLLRLGSGTNGLLQAGEPVDRAVSEMLAYTDSTGRIHPALHRIHFISTSGQEKEETLIIEAGNRRRHILIHIVPGEIGGPPRQLSRQWLGPDSVEFRWKGPADGALGFKVEELVPSGEWQERLNVSGEEIPAPDPATGEYTLLSAVQ